MRPTLDFLLARDGWVCGLCLGPILNRDDASRDHVVPRYHNGPKEAHWNVVAAHRACNAKKGHRPPSPSQVKWELIESWDLTEARHALRRISWAWQNPPYEVMAFLHGMTDDVPQSA